MKNTLRFLSAVSLLASTHAFAQNPDLDAPDIAQPEVISAEVERRTIEVPRIDSEHFEIGAFAGVLSIEDFGSDTLTGIRAAYHMSEDFFVEANYGASQAGLTSFEALSGGALLLTDEQRDYSYYNVSLGVNILPGESFIWGNRSLNTSLYIIAGAGSTEFAGDNRFTVNVGFGTRILPTDWLALHIDIRDHIFDIDVLGAEKTAHNFEFSLSLATYF